MYDSNRYRRQTRNPGARSSSTSAISSPSRLPQRPFQFDVGKIIIKNLDKEIDNKALHATFSAFGNILSCKVVQDGRGNSKGYAFVHFETEKAAQMSIERANGMLLKTRKIYVAQFIPRKEREEKELGEKAKLFTNVYVKNFGEEWDDEKLKDTFDPYGKITSHKVITKDDGKSGGFGFVTFENHVSAQLAVLCLNGKIINGKRLSVEHKVDPNMERISFEELKKQNNLLGFEICVKNLDDIIEDERLRKEFSPFGTITSAKVISDTDGRPKGLVCFNLAEEAVRAVNHMNGRMFGSKQLYVALAERKDKKFFGQQLTQIRTTPRWASFQFPNKAAAAEQLHPGASATVIRETHQNHAASEYAEFAARAIAMSSALQERVSSSITTIENMRSSPGQEPLTASLLANKTASDQKEMLGERLLPIIERTHPILGGKITGMLLEIENSELLHMLEDSSSLTAKVDEAVAVIKAHEAKQNFTKVE